MDALLLLLVDSRSPAGAHSHSLGMESAVTAGWVRTVDDVGTFCRARLRTAGAIAAAAAARAHALAGADAGPPAWAALDAELDARTPSPATRDASRALGRGLRRLVRSMLPAFSDVSAGWWPRPAVPHHPVVLGAACAAAGGTASFAARAAALGTCTAAAGAAVRLLGLDPYATQGVIAGLAPEIDAVAAAAPTTPDLPAGSLPALDLLADVHARSEVRLFAS